jgi:single-stranded-DNA-specific exonuclease
MMKNYLPEQRWVISSPDQEIINDFRQRIGVSKIVAQILYNRGLKSLEEAHYYIDPEWEKLPSPLKEFPDLEMSVELLKTAIENQEKIAICGDYDADGMTSTALLLRALKHLGANVDYAIPSRMKDGYGINQRIVEEFAQDNVALILTVDNGISAYEAIELAKDLGLDVIITDHHDLPETLPSANAILNPKLLSENSPYRSLAGVGVAYILAITLAQELALLKGLTAQLLELFTLGTIADLAPLTGVNRRWLKRGLKQLPQSQLKGIQALMQMAGIKEEQKQLNPDDIGFKLGPRINAIGRIDDPQIVIELLTTEDEGLALERAMQCEEVNTKRQQLCEQILNEALELIETEPIKWQEKRVLVVVKSGWHHGVIGIVASRLKDRYGVPVFIGTYEEKESKIIRGSARGIDEFNVFEALNYCQDLLGKYGGHKAAGGFSFPAENLTEFEVRLSEFAHQYLKPHHLKPLIKVDAELNFSQVNLALYQELEQLQPWGIENNTPIFLSSQVRIIEQENCKGHLKCTLQQIFDGQVYQIKGMAWRWGEFVPFPNLVDLVYKIKENNWQGHQSIEVEIIGLRPTKVKENQSNSQGITKQNQTSLSQIRKAQFEYKGKQYDCSLWESLNELRIRNQQGKVLAVKRGEKTGLLGFNRENALVVDVTQLHYFALIKTAIAALEK